MGVSGDELPGEFPRSMRILFSYWILSLAIGIVVLLPFIALAFAYVHNNYATRDEIRKTSLRDKLRRNGNPNDHKKRRR